MQEQQYLQKATDQMSQGLLEEAIQTLSEGLELYTGQAQLLFLLAAVNAQNKNYEHAIKHYQQTLISDPSLHIARFQLGLLLATLGDEEQATHILTPLSHGREHYLEWFAVGIIATINNNLEQAVVAITHGIDKNQENASLNNDMRAMFRRITDASQPNNSALNDETIESDNTHLLDIYQSKH